MNDALLELARETWRTLREASGRGRAMTEAEWLAGEDPARMLAWLTFRDEPVAMRVDREARVSARKLRLFGCALARSLWCHLQDATRGAVQTAERYADGEATGHELGLARARAKGATGWIPANDDAETAAWNTLAVLLPDLPVGLAPALLRDLAGNPFRPVIRPNTMPGLSCAHWWIDSDVLSIAQGCYEARRWQDLPVLGDALEDAGCTNDNLLAHLRSAGPHVRGCWALDLILGKS